LITETEVYHTVYCIHIMWWTSTDVT